MWYKTASKKEDFEKAYQDLISDAHSWILDKEAKWIASHKDQNPELARAYGWTFKDLTAAFQNKYGFVRGEGLTGIEVGKFTKQLKDGTRIIDPAKKKEIEALMALRAEYAKKWNSHLESLYQQRLQLKRKIGNVKQQNTVQSMMFADCKVSVYGLDFKNKDDGFEGKITANGEKFESDGATCAHKTLPFNTIVEFWNPKWGDKYDPSKAVRARINDRGPYKNNADFDLTRHLSSQLGEGYSVYNLKFRIVR